MGRASKPPRLVLRGSSWYIIDEGRKIACGTREQGEAITALAQYNAGKVTAAERAKAGLPRVHDDVLVKHVLDGYEAARLKDLKKKKNRSVYADTRIALLRQGVDESDAHRLADEASKRTEIDVTSIGNDRFVMKHLRAYFGLLRPSHICQAVVEEYAIRRRDEGVSRRSTGHVVRRVADGTIEKELVILRAALRWAAKDDRARWLGGAEPPAFSMPVSGARSRIRWLTKGEAAKLIAGSHLPHIRLYFRIALATGARKEAIELLRWSDVDFERNLVDFGRVEKDNNKKRPLIQMTPELRRELWNAKQVACSDYVIEFRGRRAGNVKKSIRAAIEKAGLKSVDPNEDVVGHIMKHTFVSWMLQCGKSYEEIALILNTSSATLRRTYGHVDLNAAADVADAVALDEHLQRIEWQPTSVLLTESAA
jgi:integrase